MSLLHICNVFFERELEQVAPKSLKDWLRSHPVVAQLQFLPLLYAAPEDRILVSDLPSNPDPRLCLIDTPPKGLSIEHWGPSQAIASWAKYHSIPYPLPDWEMIQAINSKVFSFISSPALPGAELLTTQKEIESWIAKTPDPKILKTPFGTAGSGHIHPPFKKAYRCPLIGEPWVERVLDFSTQWKNEKLLGVTLFENEPNGTYRGTFAGEVPSWALEEHLAAAQPIVHQIAMRGYQGHLGIDAFIYRWKSELRVHPVVEINARKTMSWVALQTKAKYLYYTQASEGLLPSHLKNQQFSRNLHFGITYSERGTYGCVKN